LLLQVHYTGLFPAIVQGMEIMESVRTPLVYWPLYLHNSSYYK